MPSDPTILYTLSKEALEKIALEDPELYLKIKANVLAEAHKKVFKYVENKLGQTVNKTSEVIYKNVEKGFFKHDQYGKIIGLSDDKVKVVQTKAEEILNERLEKDLTDYLNSEEFSSVLKLELKNKALTLVLKALEKEMQEEVKKIIA